MLCRKKDSHTKVQIFDSDPSKVRYIITLHVAIFHVRYISASLSLTNLHSCFQRLPWNALEYHSLWYDPNTLIVVSRGHRQKYRSSKTRWKKPLHVSHFLWDVFPRSISFFCIQAMVRRCQLDALSQHKLQQSAKLVLWQMWSEHGLDFPRQNMNKFEVNWHWLKYFCQFFWGLRTHHGQQPWKYGDRTRPIPCHRGKQLLQWHRHGGWKLLLASTGFFPPSPATSPSPLQSGKFVSNPSNRFNDICGMFQNFVGWFK